MRFSATRLKVWLECPLQAHFKYSLKLPELQNAAASFGKIIHAALQLYNEVGDLDIAVEKFKEWWDAPELLGCAPDYWPKNTNFSSLRVLGVEILCNYHSDLQWEQRTVVATEHGFLVPFGKHELVGYVDLLEMRKSGNGRRLLRLIDYKTNSKQPWKSDLFLDVQFCADTETEILSSRGWLRHDQLLVGEEVLTYNQGLGVAEWQPVSAVNVFPALRQQLVKMEGRGHSSLTTKNHRWAVEHTVCGQRGWRMEKRIVTTDTLSPNDRIPCAAPVLNLSKVAKHDDAFVELVAWYWTEGWLREKAVGLAQKTPEDARIRVALTTLFGQAAQERMVPTRPMWREVAGDDCTRFFLNGLASAELLYVVQGKEKLVRPEFLADLTQSQLKMFIDISIDADGHSRNGSRVITQSVKARLDAFQMACSLAGIRTVMTEERVSGNGRYVGRPFWRLALQERRPFFRPQANDNGFAIEEVEYTGEVWCPTTPNGTWLARRNGTVYFTGNTVYAYASLQPEFWTGNGPEFPGIANGEALYQEFAKVARRPIWYHLRTNKEFDCGPREDEHFKQLYRLCDEIEKAEERQVHVPRIGDATCTWCSYVNECGLEIPTEKDVREHDEAWI